MSASVTVQSSRSVSNQGSLIESAVLVASVMAILAQLWVGIINGRGLQWDFANFYDAGHKVAAGEAASLYNPKAWIEGEPPQGELAFYGTPLSAWLYAPLAWFEPETALILFKIQAAAATLAALGVLGWLYRRQGRSAFGSHRRWIAVAAFVAAIYQPFWGIYQVGGQTTPHVLLLLVLSLVLRLYGQNSLAALAFAFVVAIKPAFGLGFAALVLISGRGFALRAVVAGLLLAGISIAWMGWPLHEDFLRHVAIQIPKSWRWNSSITVVFDNLLTLSDPKPDPKALSSVASLLRVSLCAVVAGLVLSCRKAVPAGPPRRHLDFSLVLLCCFLLMPVVWEHYLAILAIPLAYLLSVHSLLPRGAVLLLALIFAATLFQNVAVIEWLNDLKRFNATWELIAAGLLKSAPLALTAVMMAAYRRAIANTYLTDEWRDFQGPTPVAFPDSRRQQ